MPLHVAALGAGAGGGCVRGARRVVLPRSWHPSERGSVRLGGGAWEKYYGLCCPWAGAIHAAAAGEGEELVTVTPWGRQLLPAPPTTCVTPRQGPHVTALHVAYGNRVLFVCVCVSPSHLRRPSAQTGGAEESAPRGSLGI